MIRQQLNLKGITMIDLGKVSEATKGTSTQINDTATEGQH